MTIDWTKLGLREPTSSVLNVPRGIPRGYAWDWGHRVVALMVNTGADDGLYVVGETEYPSGITMGCYFGTSIEEAAAHLIRLGCGKEQA